jgi:hypothetical protein
MLYQAKSMEAHFMFGLAWKVILDWYEEDLLLDYLWRFVILYFEKERNFDLCYDNMKQKLILRERFYTAIPEIIQD